MKRILFVDDESKVLSGLQRMLLPYVDSWEMEFANSGAEALRLLAQSQFDVIVADMRMPIMDGAALLKEVARLYPQMVRLILSGTWEQDLRMQAAMVAHQYMSKPCDPEVLKSTLDRAFALRDVLVEPKLRALIARTASLPSTPAIYRELIRLLQAPDASAQQIGAMLARDMAMTAKVLQLVNSAFFGMRRHITSAEDAVMFLGVETVKALALSVSAFSSFNTAACRRFSIEHAQQHGTRVAAVARVIAKSQKASRPAVDDSFVAGLLHDVGQLVFVAHHPNEYDRALAAVATGRQTVSEAERDIFGTTHAEVGGYLLWLWGLPDTVVEAVAFHHEPSGCLDRQFSPLTAVHVANVLEEAGRDGAAAGGNQIDDAYLARLGMAGQMPAWVELAEECLAAEAAL
jgi:HD-like signal output (HDOD) protein